MKEIDTQSWSSVARTQQLQGVQIKTNQRWPKLELRARTGKISGRRNQELAARSDSFHVGAILAVRSVEPKGKNKSLARR
jgi:hypothetical protein